MKQKHSNKQAASWTGRKDDDGLGVGCEVVLGVEEAAGVGPEAVYASDLAVFVGAPAHLAELLHGLAELVVEPALVASEAVEEPHDWAGLAVDQRRVGDEHPSTGFQVTVHWSTCCQSCSSFLLPSTLSFASATPLVGHGRCNVA
jgi:hypothetical protein